MKNIVGEKMTRNSRKMAIRAGGLGQLLLERDPLVSSIVVSVYNNRDSSKQDLYTNMYFDQSIKSITNRGLRISLQKFR